MDRWCRRARSGASPPFYGGEGGGAAAEEAPQFEAGTAEAVASNMDAAGLGDIVHEWGGPESPNFAAERRLPALAVEHVTRHDPELLAILNGEIEDERGNVTRLGDNPALVRAAAELGLHLSLKGVPVDPLPSARRRR